MGKFKDKLNSEAYDIARFCADNQQPDGGFPYQSFYGMAYALALWRSLGEEFAENALLAQNWYVFEIPELLEDPEAHWEFINYGFLRAGLPAFDHFRDNRRVINWVLLKLLCLALMDKLTLEDIEYGMHTVDGYQKGGLIPDFATPESINNPSYQYHNFSTCLLGELVTCGYPEFERYFCQGISYVIKNMLSYGDINYVGRGAKQIKGYVVGIHALVQAGAKAAAQHVFRYLLHFKRNDGPYPLMFDIDEPNYHDLITGRPKEWESYNNYFDYIPLAGYYLRRAAELC